MFRRIRMLWRRVTGRDHYLRERYGLEDKPRGWNDAVLGHFHHSAELRPGIEWPVPRGVTLSAAEIRERNRRAIESGRFKPLPLVVVDPATGRLEE